MSNLNQYTVNIVNCDELYVQGKKIQNLDIGTLTTYNQTYGVGISTDNPRLTLDINGTDAMRIPIGTNAQRPLVARPNIFNDHPTLVNAANNRLEGCIRYNSSSAMFEGWSTGNGQWENLANTSTLKILPSNGYVGIKTTGNPTQALEVNGNSYLNGNVGIGGYNSNYKLYLNGNSYLNGNVGIKTTSSATEALDINGNLRLHGNLMMTGKQKLHIGSYNSNTPTMSDSACVYIGGDHNVTNTLLKIADYNNDSTTSSHKVVHFYSENKDDDYYFQAATNGGYHYYKGYLGIGTSPSSSYRININGRAHLENGGLEIGGTYTSSYGIRVHSGVYYNLSYGGSLYVVTSGGHVSQEVPRNNYWRDAYYGTNDGAGIGYGYIRRYYYYWYYGDYWSPLTTYFRAILQSSGKISIRADNAIYGSKFIVSSDERIKENIELVPDNLSLSIIRKLEPKYYTYKDTLEKGSVKQIGFMAQEVLEHIPDAVRFTSKIIPNEMKLVSKPIWTTFHDLSGNLKYKLTISDLKDPSGNILYRFHVSNNQDVTDEEKKEISSLQNEPTSFVFDKKWNNVFVYGREVHDFHVLDKAKIWAVAYSALQEVDKIQQSEQTKLKEAESKIKNLENQLVSVLSRLNNLEKN